MMKLIFAVIAVFVVYVSAQKVGVAPNGFRRQYKILKNFISTSGKVKYIQKTLTWKHRKTCLPDDMSMLPQRLLDWFHVLKSQMKSKTGGDFNDLVNIKAGCSSKALLWFFNQFDSNNDMLLDTYELDEIENIPYEHCLKQFFYRCDLNKDRMLSLPETCGCFSVEPPCFKLLKNYEIKEDKYTPKCDEDGFFESRQCFKESCWCVNRFNEAIERTLNKAALVECRDNTDPNELLFTGEEEEEEEEMDEEQQRTD